jgi:hypothetical protein
MKLHLIALAFILAASLSAKADNLVQNGDFSTGDFTDWQTQLGNSGDFLTVGYDLPTGSGFQPGYAAEFGAQLPSDFIQQSISTTSGTTYQLTFSLLTYETPNDFQANLGGTLETDSISGGHTLDISGTSTDEFNQYSLTFTATSSTTEVILGGYNVNASDYVTDVSVEAEPAAAAPEPSTWALLLGSAGLLVLWRRRRAAI